MALIAPARPIHPVARKLRQTGWILLVLLVAAAFRLINLSDAPPGMTHDEADHGLTAWEIVNGAREIYFTVGYGREPLYDYLTAIVMAATGPTILAPRLTSAYLSLILIAAVYAWSWRAFGRPVGLLAAAGLAVGFWPVMAGRQALRSIALPAVFGLAVLFFWRGIGGDRRHPGNEFVLHRSALVILVVAGLLLGLTFYTYIPARALWMAFPALAIYLALARPPAARSGRHLFAATALTLVVALLVAAPLLIYLANHPGVEVRIDELSAPLQIAADGNFAPLWFNARGALRLFTIEGDQTWRYNLPGQPFLGPVMGALFYAGLLVAGWLAILGFRNRVYSEKLGFYWSSVGPGAFLALVWLALGFAPVLATGPGLSVTQAIGMLPVLYVFPALALAAACAALSATFQPSRRTRRIPSLPNGPRNQPGFGSAAGEQLAGYPGRGLWFVVCSLLVLALFTILAAQTVRDYFGRWANAPEVRVQYESTMVAVLRYLDEKGSGAAAVSTITPGRYHTPAVALLTLHNPAVQPRWFDGRQSLLFPAEAGGLMVVPGFTPIPAELRPYLGEATKIEELPMRPDDLDRPVRIYRLDVPVNEVAASTTPLLAGIHTTDMGFDYARLLGYDLAAPEAHPGESLSLVTAWRLEQPLPGASLFAHVVGPAGRPVAVGDGLDAPGESWVAGDILLQLHTISIPSGTPAGEYPLVVGIYNQSDGQRLVSEVGEDAVTLTTVRVADE